MKKRRIDEPLPTSIDEAARKTAAPDISGSLPSPAADDGDDLNADPVADTQLSPRETKATTRWTPQEDAELTSAGAKTCKKKLGKKHRIDWFAVALLFPDGIMSWGPKSAQ